MVKLLKKLIFYISFHYCHFTHFYIKCQWLNQENKYSPLFILSDLAKTSIAKSSFLAIL